MSRSYRKAITKDKGDGHYNRKFRRVNKQRVHEEKEPIKMNSLINCYDVHDYIFNMENNPYTMRFLSGKERKEFIKKLRRK